MKKATSRQGPLSPAPLAVALACAFGVGLAQGNPVGGVAVHGTVQVTSPAPNQLLVTTTNGAGTSHSVVNWQSFSIPGGSLTHIAQPDAGSLSINRVTTLNNPSLIYGTLSSNGQVLLVNPAGITVGAGAVVDTAGFQASTLGLGEADAIAGRLRFEGGGGELKVQGQVVAREGDVVLLAPQVVVEAGGVVRAPNGSVVLAAGQKAELTGRGLEGIQLQVQAPADRAVNLGTLSGDAVAMFAGTLKHSGLIQASAVSQEGGRVVLKAQELAEVGGTTRAERLERLGGLFHATARETVVTAAAVIDVSGAAGGGEALIGGGWQGHDARLANATYTRVDTGAQIRADATDSGDGGTVVVWADGATAFGGNISARGGLAGGDGGMVEVSGKQHLLFVGQVDTSAPQGAKGELWLDPTDIVISSGVTNNVSTVVGADTAYFPTLNGSVLNVVTLENALATNDVRVVATGGGGTGTGKISISDIIDWNSSSTLTLQSGTAGSVEFIGTGSVNAGSGTLVINAGTGGVDGPTSGGALAIDTLDITTTGAVTFGSSGTNQVGTLKVDAGGAVSMQFNQANALNVAKVLSGGNITLGNSGTGTMQFSGNVTSDGDLNLTAGTGGIGQSSGSVLQANLLTVNSTGNVSLTGANQVSSLQADMGNGTAFSFRNAQSLAIATAAPAPAIDMGTGASSLTVDVTGDLTVSQDIQYDGAAGASVKLKASGAIALNSGVVSSSGGTYTSLVELDAGGNLSGAGVVEAGKLALRTGGTSNLSSSQDVLLLAASIGSGDFSFDSSDNLTLGSAGSVSGVTAAGNITIDASDDLDITAAVSSLGGNIAIDAGGSLTLSSGGSLSATQITLTASPPLALNGKIYPGRAGVAGGELILNGSAVFGSTSELHLDLGATTYDKVTVSGVSNTATFQPGARLLAAAAGSVPVGFYTVLSGDTGGTLPTLGGSLGNTSMALGSIILTVAAPPLTQTITTTPLFEQEVAGVGTNLLPETVLDPAQALADDDIVVDDVSCRPR